MLTYHERKARLPFGARNAVATKVGVAPSTVTHVLKGIHRNRRVEIALASLMRPRTRVTEAFGPPGPDSMRRSRAEAAA